LSLTNIVAQRHAWHWRIQQWRIVIILVWGVKY